MNSITELTQKINRPAAVHYDATTRQYVIELRLPCGPENKTRAEWLALSYTAPQIANAARDLVALGHDEARALRAGWLIVEGRVTEYHRNGDYVRAIVQASGENRSPVTGQPFYHVYHNLIWTCDCRDYEHNRDAGHRNHKCKHITAAAILDTLSNEASQAAERKAADRAERALAIEGMLGY